ncbi:MAG: hypothetical protein GF421_07815 [Candidatus Aminicenantes bacterium]|nr:hypothetical protein [Candidatus Aminicenantes bacterium]
MKKCPFCDRSFPDDQIICPQCDSPYWSAEDSQEYNHISKQKKEEEGGCLSLLLMPITISLLVTVFLVSAGFIVHLVIHLENNQVKLLWIGLSVLLGSVAYKYFKHQQEK